MEGCKGDHKKWIKASLTLTEGDERNEEEDDNEGVVRHPGESVRRSVTKRFFSMIVLCKDVLFFLNKAAITGYSTLIDLLNG